MVVNKPTSVSKVPAPIKIKVKRFALFEIENSIFLIVQDYYFFNVSAGSAAATAVIIPEASNFPYSAF